MAEAGNDEIRIDGTEEGGGTALLTRRGPATPLRLPVGPEAQLAALEEQLRWCSQSLGGAVSDAARAMADEQIGDRERWAQVRRLRTMAWKVVREVLPLTERIPAALHGTPAHQSCLRVAHELRRSTEAALARNANYTVDLLSADALTGRTW